MVLRLLAVALVFVLLLSPVVAASITPNSLCYPKHLAKTPNIPKPVVIGVVAISSEDDEDTKR